MTPQNPDKTTPETTAPGASEDPARTVIVSDELTGDDEQKAGLIVLREYEDRLASAQAQADQPLVDEINEQYHDARLTRFKADKARTRKAERAAEKEGASA